MDRSTHLTLRKAQRPRQGLPCRASANKKSDYSASAWLRQPGLWLRKRLETGGQFKRSGGLDLDRARAALAGESSAGAGGWFVPAPAQVVDVRSYASQ